MRLRRIFLGLTGCLLVWAASSGAARSQPIQGFYVGAGAGLRAPFATKTTSLVPGVRGAFDLNQSLGYDTQLSIGYALGNGWRFELEGTLGRSGISSTSHTSLPTNSSGAVQSHGVMANAVFDLDVRSRYIYPYLGLGLGYQWTRLDGFSATAIGQPGAVTAGGTAGAFAAQAIVGVSFPIPNMPGLSVTVDYRLMDILGGGRYPGASSIGLPAGSAPLTGTVKLHNQFDQTAMFGVRYAFNTPPPAAVVAQAAPLPRAEQQSYEVAFDRGRPDLTDRARAVVRAAATASTRQGTTRIAVTGGGDAPAGAADRRANIVVAALLADGVPRDAIAVRHSGGDPGAAGPGERWVEIVTR